MYLHFATFLYLIKYSPLSWNLVISVRMYQWLLLEISYFPGDALAMGNCPNSMLFNIDKLKKIQSSPTSNAIHRPPITTDSAAQQFAEIVLSFTANNCSMQLQQRHCPIAPSLPNIQYYSHPPPHKNRVHLEFPSVHGVPLGDKFDDNNLRTATALFSKHIKSK